MERKPPVLRSEEIDLYIRTYNSLLRSSGKVRVRAFEEAHAYSASSLHPRALSLEPDLAAFAYAAARLPAAEMLDISLVVLGQSHELFEAAGHHVRSWRVVRTRGRRRALRYDGKTTLAVFIASVSDIDDLVPIITAYQMEWNKMHGRLHGAGTPTDALVQKRLDVDEAALATLKDAFGPGLYPRAIAAVQDHEVDLSVQMLASSYSQFQRAAQRWWGGIEPSYVKKEHPRRAPVYFVSSNTHAIANLVGGYARAHEGAIVDFARATDPEGLRSTLEEQLAAGSEDVTGLVHYLLRPYIHADRSGKRMKEVRAFEAEGGLLHLSEPGHVDVDAQLVELSKVDPTRVDPRLLVPGLERLTRSEALIINIDYPLGMAAYHLLARLGQGVGDVRGVYVMGKAATLNGRIGDVMLSGNVYDEHTRNTFLFDNAFDAKDIEPHLRRGNVFDNQAALTVRSAFLQNRNYMNAFYQDGYTVLEMEAGPFLSATYELVHSTRVPTNEIVHLGGRAPFEVGLVHYASDTPYSRRQSLLSKSLSYFGVDATYACAIAIVRRIFEQELARVTR